MTFNYVYDVLEAAKGRLTNDWETYRAFLRTAANNYKRYGLPCFETIRRARQRVQSLFPKLSRNRREPSGDVSNAMKIVIELR